MNRQLHAMSAIRGTDISRVDLPYEHRILASSYTRLCKGKGPLGIMVLSFSPSDQVTRTWVIELELLRRLKGVWMPLASSW